MTSYISRCYQGGYIRPSNITSLVLSTSFILISNENSMNTIIPSEHSKLITRRETENKTAKKEKKTTNAQSEHKIINSVLIKDFLM